MSVLALATTTRAQSVGNPKLVFTEIDSMHLTATDGIGNPVGTVNVLGPDLWSWDSGVSSAWGPGLGGNGIGWTGNAVYGLWAETGVGAGVNFVFPGSFGHFGATVTSDDPIFFLTGNANGAYGGTLTAETFNYIGVSNVVTTVAFKYDVYFNDLGDVANPANSVPDARSTAGILLLSISILFGVARRFAHSLS